MSDDVDTVALLQERVEEVEALQACFPDLLTLAPAEADALLFAKHVCQAGSSAAAPADVPALSGLLRLPDVEIGGSPVLLKFVLPRLGGGDGVPSLQVISNAPRQDADSLQQLASEVVEECARDGTLCLLLAADRLASAARDIAAGERQQAAAQQPSCAGAAAQQQQQRSSEQGLVLSRCCIWFHHIKNLTKRKSIVEWGRELRLGGLCKPGFPGVLLVEGAADDVAEYCSRLRGLRWQAMAVRGEEDVVVGSQQELEAARRLPLGVEELGEGEMGRLAAASREAGLEALFLTALKLAPGR